MEHGSHIGESAGAVLARAGPPGNFPSPPIKGGWLTLTLGAVALIGLIYMGYSAFKPSAPRADFYYYWLAGELWLEGISPYGPAFPERGATLGASGYPPVFWAYPPNWWMISVPLSRIPQAIAIEFWTLLQIGLVALSSELLRRARFEIGLSATFPIFLAIFAFGALSSGTSTALMWGNGATLVLVGGSLCALGLAGGSRTALIAGLMVLALKPNVGAPVFAALLLSRHGWREAIVASILSLLIAVPAFLVTSPLETLRALSRTAAEYESYMVNGPEWQNGFVHLVYLATGLEVRGMLTVIMATMVAGVMAVLISRKIPSSPIASLLPLLSALLIVALLVRLHSYDLVLLLPVLSLTVPRGTGQMLIWLCSGLLLLRPENCERLAELLTGAQIMHGTMPTIGVILLSIIFYWRHFIDTPSDASVLAVQSTNPRK